VGGELEGGRRGGGWIILMSRRRMYPIVRRTNRGSIISKAKDCVGLPAHLYLRLFFQAESDDVDMRGAIEFKIQVHSARRSRV
jgi:hypothetical protein